jgi:very-short-patch-repair endonuclease
MARDNDSRDDPRIWAVRDRTLVAPQVLFARSMRRVPTEAEKKLWWHLHRLSLKGSHFRRQVRLGRYIVDFASHKARVVIEVDGGQHAENETDDVRAKFIEGQGYRVMRFWNNDVLNNIEGVLEAIQAAIPNHGETSDYTRVISSPSPLVGEGRGGG